MTLSPGSHLLIENVSWEQYEALLAELGEERLVPRINYCHSTLELMAPLPAHKGPNRIIADIVKVLLNSQDRDWEDFGSTTFRKAQEAGLEPDTSIDRAERMRACERFYPEHDPPPDLAIESDVTSKTTLEAYQVLPVPEVWIHTEKGLKIQVLNHGQYRLSAESPTFPSLPIIQMIPRLVKQAKQIGTRQMLKQLRQDVGNQ